MIEAIWCFFQKQKGTLHIEIKPLFVNSIKRNEPLFSIAQKDFILLMTFPTRKLIVAVIDPQRLVKFNHNSLFSDKTMLIWILRIFKKPVSRLVHLCYARGEAFGPQS